MTKTNSNENREQRCVAELIARVSDTIQSINSIREYMNRIVEEDRALSAKAQAI